MSAPDVYVPGLGTIKWGRIASSCAVKSPLIDDAYLAGLPDPPASVDYATAALASLHDPYLNNVIGNCGIASGYHILGGLTANAGSIFSASSAQISADYLAIGQTYPPDDLGADTLSATAYWASHGFANGSKILGCARLDPSNVRAVKMALWLFGNVSIGMSMASGWPPKTTSDNYTWDVSGAPGPHKDHLFSGHGYDSTGITISTWGYVGKLTWAALDAYCGPTGIIGELYVYLMRDVVGSQATSPSGHTWAQLVDIFNGLFGAGIGSSGRHTIKRGRTWRQGRRSDAVMVP